MSISLELLAPAGNAEIGMAAIDHGADAVYIGAPQFGARSQAGQEITEIARLIKYAHLFHARVYVALNTILQDHEMDPALEIIKSVDEIGADGLIIQDMGLLEMDLPPIPLIASTQMHNTTPERVKFLEDVGFRKVVLARELSVKEISLIRDLTTVELEVFVHGALCVSYSGQCYMSQFSCGRSANRGSCSQPCRHSYTLKDGNGKTVIIDKHLLSLKDMNRLDSIPDLIDAGATSFKIEGRYKDMDYVKNITAAYRLALDSYISNNPTYYRAGSGSCTFTFQPDPEKTFNRGYTSYYLQGKREKTASLNSPKSTGQLVGKVDSLGRDFFQIRKHDLQNGDGLCFLTPREILSGCRVNRVENGRVYPNKMSDISVGTEIFRNFDFVFSKSLKHSTSCRHIDISMEFTQKKNCIILKLKDEDGIVIEYRRDLLFEEARDQTMIRKNIATQLKRTGNTPYRVTGIEIYPNQTGFIALSVLNDMRRQALIQLSQARVANHIRQSVKMIPSTVSYPEKELDYQGNIANTLAVKFYTRHGVSITEKAVELSEENPDPNFSGRTVMTTRYCLRYQLDACLKHGNEHLKHHYKEPLMIFDKGHVYRLEFQCRECRMLVIAEN